MFVVVIIDLFLLIFCNDVGFFSAEVFFILIICLKAETKYK